MFSWLLIGHFCFCMIQVLIYVLRNLCHCCYFGLSTAIMFCWAIELDFWPVYFDTNVTSEKITKWTRLGHFENKINVLTPKVRKFFLLFFAFNKALCAWVTLGVNLNNVGHEYKSEACATKHSWQQCAQYLAYQWFRSGWADFFRKKRLVGMRNRMLYRCSSQKMLTFWVDRTNRRDKEFPATPLTFGQRGLKGVHPHCTCQCANLSLNLEKILRSGSAATRQDCHSNPETPARASGCRPPSPVCRSRQQPPAILLSAFHWTWWKQRKKKSFQEVNTRTPVPRNPQQETFFLFSGQKKKSEAKNWVISMLS